jgi:hypothetical protein
MSTQDSGEDDATREGPKRETLPWLRATVEDVQALDFEAPITGSSAADSHELSDQFRAALPPTEEGTEPLDTAAVRVFGMLSAVTGIRFTPEHGNEPFAPMAVLADGRRSPIPEDFRGAPLEVLAYMAERAANTVLRARRRGLQHPQTPLRIRLSEPCTIRGSPRPATCQNRGLKLSTIKGALHRVDSLRCEGSDAIGAKRTCRERRERVDPTKMTRSCQSAGKFAVLHNAVFPTRVW